MDGNELEVHKQQTIPKELKKIENLDSSATLKKQKAY
jgi:hypothetical protein